MSKRWQKVEINFLKKHAQTKSLAELAERFHTDEDAVRDKLRELNLGGTAAGTGADAEVASFEEGLKALYEGRWPEAVAALESVIRESDQPELVARARQFWSVARERRRAAEAPEVEVDPYVRAVAEKNRGNLDAALELCRSNDRQRTEERFAYLAASIHALRGSTKEAADCLGTAIELNPRNRFHAVHDPDFEPLRADRKYASLFGVP